MERRSRVPLRPRNQARKNHRRNQICPEEIQSLKKQYTSLFGKAPRGPSANKQEWLEQKSLESARIISVKETVDQLCEQVESSMNITTP